MPSSPRVTLITGGSRGLGRSTALALAARGVDSVLTYRTERAAADAVVAEVAALGRTAVAVPLVAGDTAGFGAFADALGLALRQTWGRETFDALVNNAGGALYASVAETTEEAFDEIVNVHFKGVFFLTQRLMPMIADGGRIVNVSSGLARFAYPGRAAYAAAKGAVEVLTRYLAQELGPRGIAVNTVAPGAIATDFGGGGVRDNPDVNQHIAQQTALGRVGLPDDIGPMIAALLSDDLRWVNGQRIEVSGGIHL